MMLFPTAIAAERLWDGEMIGIDVDGVPVLILRVGGELHAFRDACVHQAIRLSEGKLAKDPEDGRRFTLTCRAHQWRYDAATGQGVNPSTVCLTRLPLEVRDGVIVVDPHPPSPPPPHVGSGGQQ
jgi:toluene monooxygenase system ferredoxin subunit